MTEPREPFETDSAVEGIDLDDARADVRGSADLETGAGETGSAEGSIDTTDQDTATGVADVTPVVESGGRAESWSGRRNRALALEGLLGERKMGYLDTAHHNDSHGFHLLLLHGASSPTGSTLPDLLKAPQPI